MRASIPCAAGLVLLILSTLAHAEVAPSKVQGTIVIPAKVPSFMGSTLEIKLWEYDPFLADASAKLFDEVIVKDYGHAETKETTTKFVIGEKANGGKTTKGRNYYVTLFVLVDGKRTHIGELNGKRGLCKVLTGGNPNKIKMVVRPVR